MYNHKGTLTSCNGLLISAGGERNRLHLATVLKQSGNLLLLDEVGLVDTVMPSIAHTSCNRVLPPRQCDGHSTLVAGLSRI